MSEEFDAEIRRMGDSLGVIIPDAFIKAVGCGQGDIVNITIISPDMVLRNRKIRALAGLYRNKPGFEREKNDRYRG